VNVCPTTVIVAVRVCVVAFAAYTYAIDPLPAPLAFVSVSQEALLEAPHNEPAGETVMPTVPEPAPLPAVADKGLNVTAGDTRSTKRTFDAYNSEI
jgi:hypothetical protein